MRAARWLAAMFAVALTCVVAAPAGASAPTFVYGTDCREHQAFVEGDTAAVAARLPRRYTAMTDPGSGHPLLFVRAMHCAGVDLGGRTAPATIASYGMVVDSPDGRGCGSGTPAGSVKGDLPPVCNWYVVSWLANDRRLVRWMRAGTSGFPAVHVPGLAFDLGGFDSARGGAPFHAAAPAPTPSPFTMDDVSRERPGELSVRVGYWADTPQGTVKLAGSSEDLTAGDATGSVHAAPGSELATLLGATERPYLPAYSGLSAVHFGHGVYRKQVLAPAPGAHSFAGSCSFQGDVTFSPPATNNPAPLVYSYPATGTCTGTLDGRRLSSAPVKVQQSGHSYGTCSRANTTLPGQGALTFANGTTVRYTLDFTTAGTEVDMTAYGERSGTARARGTFLTQRTPPDVAAQCAGKGAATVPMDTTFTTEKPLVGAPPAPRPRLRLSVSPRSVRAGRRTAFAFRTAPGAGVRFAGRVAHAGRGGTATIVAVLHRRGRRTARATLAGFRAATVTVRVRPGRARG